MPSVQQVLFVYILSNPTFKQTLNTIFYSVEKTAVRLHTAYAKKRPSMLHYYILHVCCVYICTTSYNTLHFESILCSYLRQTKLWGHL